MAALTMASLPLVSSGFMASPLHRSNHLAGRRRDRPLAHPYAAQFGTDEVADAAAGAAIAEVNGGVVAVAIQLLGKVQDFGRAGLHAKAAPLAFLGVHFDGTAVRLDVWRSEEHTSELQSLRHLVCRLLL